MHHSFLLKLYRYCFKISTLKLFLLAVFIPLTFSILIALLTELFPDVFYFPDDDYDVMTMIKNKPYLIASIVLFAPAIETLIQYIPVKISTAFLSSRYRYANILSVLISAVIFASLHRSGLLYFIPLFFLGLVLAFSCLIFIKQKLQPYAMVAMIHACYNAILLGLDFLIYS